GHQRSFNHMERSPIFLAGFLSILIDKVDDAFNKRMREPIFNGAFAPLVVLFLFLYRAFESLSKLQQAFRCIVTAVEQYIFHPFEEFLVDLVVNFKHRRVHDAHIHTVADSMIKKRGVHGFANLLISAEGKRDVADASAHVSVWEVFPNPLSCPEEIKRVVAMFFNACSYRKNIRIKDDVLRRKLNHVNQQIIGALADGYSTFKRVGLTGFIKSHHHHRCTVAPHKFRLTQKFFFSTLETYRVYDTPSLKTFKTCFNDFPFG